MQKLCFFKGNRNKKKAEEVIVKVTVSEERWCLRAKISKAGMLALAAELPNTSTICFRVDSECEFVI